jgi:hypothetical protein
MGCTAAASSIATSSPRTSSSSTASGPSSFVTLGWRRPRPICRRTSLRGHRRTGKSLFDAPDHPPDVEVVLAVLRVLGVAGVPVHAGRCRLELDGGAEPAAAQRAAPAHPRGEAVRPRIPGPERPTLVQPRQAPHGGRRAQAAVTRRGGRLGDAPKEKGSGIGVAQRGVADRRRRRFREQTEAAVCVIDLLSDKELYCRSCGFCTN